MRLLNSILVNKDKEVITQERQETTPCDIPQSDGKYVCPFKDIYTGYEDEMCRVCCGLGVDE